MTTHADHPRPDALIERLVACSALAVHDAEARDDRIMAQMPAGAGAAALVAWLDQRAAAKADVEHARAAHADALRLATGRTFTPEEANVISWGVLQQGPAAVSQPPRGPSAQQAPTAERAAPRPRGAGRPRARRASSSSATAGQDPGGDDGPPPRRRALVTFARLHRLTPGLPGHWRRRLFCALPACVQDAAWRDLERGAQR